MTEVECEASNCDSNICKECIKDKIRIKKCDSFKFYRYMRN